MKIAIGCDHGGFHLKTFVLGELSRLGHDVHDYGAKTFVPDDDYPDFVRLVGQAIHGGEAELGILICGSGVGASIAANKMRGIRAAICHDIFSARQGVEDDKMNVLCLGGRVIGESLAAELVRAFLAASFSGAERHLRRLDKVAKLECESSSRSASDA
ncbi:MAG: ribose 5-phosphate isomerase B [Planctomycetales bacterium]|nr:ribose 5-phosphate isomerase B [Planctomycetales bacterium]